ncbi:MAG: hypothetical protein A2W98_15475 [Bacteroidetes bacterium GWF2_33_38]|nr:MAG: hypothetical protein A2W98_15475 [Bacteroidetes bacterium GWF2_33_38]OFY73568.1 MAG: hypothetical protein A2265_09375 [Bacteroidetes bacterium RIFOXYA12_FULL_33_9]OFY91468.1 MAG: hypothetical protein A2236_03345 [Bacteroidetes bacterium RIFOXYA2_FULL_33_7]
MYSQAINFDVNYTTSPVSANTMIVYFDNSTTVSADASSLDYPIITHMWNFGDGSSFQGDYPFPHNYAIDDVSMSQSWDVTYTVSIDYDNSDQYDVTEVYSFTVEYEAPLQSLFVNLYAEPNKTNYAVGEEISINLEIIGEEIGNYTYTIENTTNGVTNYGSIELNRSASIDFNCPSVGVYNFQLNLYKNGEFRYYDMLSINVTQDGSSAEIGEPCLNVSHTVIPYEELMEEGTIEVKMIDCSTIESMTYYFHLVVRRAGIPIINITNTEDVYHYLYSGSSGGRLEIWSPESPEYIYGNLDDARRVNLHLGDDPVVFNIEYGILKSNQINEYFKKIYFTVTVLPPNNADLSKDDRTTDSNGSLEEFHLYGNDGCNFITMTNLYDSEDEMDWFEADIDHSTNTLSINISPNMEENDRGPIEIRNTGDSPLTWDVGEEYRDMSFTQTSSLHKPFEVSFGAEDVTPQNVSVAINQQFGFIGSYYTGIPYSDYNYYVQYANVEVYDKINKRKIGSIRPSYYTYNDDGPSFGTMFITNIFGGEDIWGEYDMGSNLSIRNKFGHSIDVAGDFLIVGDPGFYPTGGVIDVSKKSKGGASIYGYNGSEFYLDGIIDGEDVLPNDNVESSFGGVVAISGDYAVVGMPNASYHKTLGYSAGVQWRTFFIYKKGASWTYQDAISLPNYEDMIDISGDYILIGSHMGKVSLYKRNGDSWNNPIKMFNYSNPISKISINGDFIGINGDVYYKNEGGNDNWGLVSSFSSDMEILSVHGDYIFENNGNMNINLHKKLDNNTYTYAENFSIPIESDGFCQDSYNSSAIFASNGRKAYFYEYGEGSIVIADKLQFPATDINSETYNFLTIKNISSSPVNITNIEIINDPNEEFSFVTPLTLPFTLSSTSTGTFKIKFSPVSEGVKNAKILVYSETETKPRIVDIIANGKEISEYDLVFPDISELNGADYFLIGSSGIGWPVNYYGNGTSITWEDLGLINGDVTYINIYGTSGTSVVYNNSFTVYYSDCIVSRNFSNNSDLYTPHADIEIYRASDEITAGNNLVLDNAGVVHFRAGRTVRFNSGFWVKNNTYLRAYLEGCNTNHSMEMSPLTLNNPPSPERIKEGVNDDLETQTDELISQKSTIIKEDAKYVLQNWELLAMPNPTKNETTVRYVLKKDSRVNITIYDILGKKVAEVLDDNQISGIYNQRIDLSVLPEGIYVCVFQNNEERKRVNLVKNN